MALAKYWDSTNLIFRAKKNFIYFTYSMTNAVTFKNYLENKEKQLYLRAILHYSIIYISAWKGFLYASVPWLNSTSNSIKRLCFTQWFKVDGECLVQSSYWINISIIFEKGISKWCCFLSLIKSNFLFIPCNQYWSLQRKNNYSYVIKFYKENILVTILDKLDNFR